MLFAKTSFAFAIVIGISIGLVLVTNTATARNPIEQEPEDPKVMELIEFQNALTKVCKARGDKETPLDKLMRERTEAAVRETEERVGEFRVGRGTLFELLTCSRNAKESALELAVNKEQELAIRKGYLALMTFIYNLNKARWEVGAIRQHSLESSRFARLDAQIQYLKAGGK